MNNQFSSLPNFVNNTSFEDTKITPYFDTLGLQDVEKHLKELVNKEKDYSFPVQVLPKQVQDILFQTNECLNFPIDFIAAALFHAVGTATGKTHLFRWKWDSYGVLWLVLVGYPGTNKTHPIQWAYAPIYAKDDLNYLLYEEAKKEYEKKMAAKRDPSNTDYEQPVKPRLSKFIVSDATIEGLIYRHQFNPRGLCLVVDELAGFIINMNRYNSGSDEQQYNSMWSQARVTVDRKSDDESIKIECPFVPVIGTIQPEIDDIERGTRGKNGFSDRMLYVNPIGLKRRAWNTKQLPDEVKRTWEEIIEKLLALDFAPDGSPNVLEMSPEAEAIIVPWQAANVDEDNTIENKKVGGISSKIETYCLRFCLIIQMMRWACGEAGKDYIDATTATAATQLADYFKRNAIEIAASKQKSPVDFLTEDKREVYEALPNEFTTAEGLRIAADLKFAKRTFELFLTEDRYFKKQKKGCYSKNFSSVAVAVVADSAEHNKNAA